MSQGAPLRHRGQACQTVPSAARTGGSNKDAQLWQVGTLCSVPSAYVGCSCWVLLGLPALLPDAAAHKGCLTLLLPSSEAGSAQYYQISIVMFWVLTGPHCSWDSDSLSLPQRTTAPCNLPDIN